MTEEQEKLLGSINIPDVTYTNVQGDTLKKAMYGFAKMPFLDKLIDGADQILKDYTLQSPRYAKMNLDAIQKSRKDTGKVNIRIKDKTNNRDTFEVDITVLNKTVVRFQWGYYPACCGLRSINFFSSALDQITGLSLKERAELIDFIVIASQRYISNDMHIGHGRMVLNLVSTPFSKDVDTVTPDHNEAYAKDMEQLASTGKSRYAYFPDWHYWANCFRKPENQIFFRNENSGNIIATTFVKTGR